MEHYEQSFYGIKVRGKQGKHCITLFCENAIVGEAITAFIPIIIGELRKGWPHKQQTVTVKLTDQPQFCEITHVTDVAGLTGDVSRYTARFV